MQAKTAYCLREQTEFCSGADLSEFFTRCGLGPSPSGNQRLKASAFVEFVNECALAMRNNSPRAFASLFGDDPEQYLATMLFGKSRLNDAA